jgi:hypothetical protein
VQPRVHGLHGSQSPRLRAAAVQLLPVAIMH